jgi:hypothetical protein
MPCSSWQDKHRADSGARCRAADHPGLRRPVGFTATARLARRVSTRAYLYFLEERGWIASAEEIERRAIQNGRDFSRIRFP